VTPKRGSESADGLRQALWIAVATGLAAETYLPFARAGYFVASAGGLLWPCGIIVGLTGIIVLGLRAVPYVDRVVAAAAAVAGLFVCAIAVLNLLPPIARDELSYHLAMPALYLRAGRVFEVEFNDHAYYPMLLEMLYTPILAHLGENIAKYWHLAFGLASCAILLLYLRDRVRLQFAVLAAVLVLTTPTIAILAASAYVDLGLLLYGSVAIIALLRWAETEERVYFLIAALGAGCCASVKYNGMLVVLSLALAVALTAQKRGGWRTVGLALAFGMISLVPLMPWLIKNAWETGNPIFPLFNQALGGRPLPDHPQLDVFTGRRALYGEHWYDTALVPIRVFITGQAGDPGRFDGVFNPLYLLGAAAALSRGRPWRDRLLFAFAACFLVLVFFLAPFRSRYTVVILTPLAVLTAEALERWHRRAGRAAGIAVVAIATSAMVFNIAHFVQFWQSVDPLAYLSGRQSRTEFITRFVPEYPVTAYANAHLPAASLVYLAFLGDRGYYWNHRYTYDSYYSGIALRDTARQAADAQHIAAMLRESGTTHIACNDRLLVRYMRDNLSEMEYRCWQEFIQVYVKPMYVHKEFGLYRIVIDGSVMPP
jgi:hypothetical protein